MPASSPSLHFPLVRLIVSSTMNVPLDSVTADSSYLNLEGWDSLANIALVARLSEGFAIDIDDEEFESLTSVAAILELLDAKAPRADREF